MNEDSGFDVATLRTLLNVENKHFWFIARREAILKLLQINCFNLYTIRMLEIGCGTGTILEFLQKHGINIEGGDISGEAITICENRLDSINLHKIDVQSLPFHEEYDVIALFDVLEHIENDEKVLYEVNKALKPGGKLILTVPAYQALWRRFDEMSGHIRRYGKRELCEILQRNNFQIRKISYYMMTLLPVFVVFGIASKLFKFSKHGGLEESPELKIIPVFNEIVLFILRVENLALSRFSLPYGTSLIVVADKSKE